MKPSNLGDSFHGKAFQEVKGADMEETGLRGRETREKVRGDKVGQAFTGGKEKRRGVDGGGAQMEDACPCSSIAPCLHHELHAAAV